ncbi:MAG: Mov34/MPN/PAD-1 family protein, partial [Chloroflexi bacterium]|nr:Mov34/MPN/PAD-1 family protein [Chloroflexota bacterium]
MQSGLSLARRHVQEMVAQAREEAPNECCGVLAGKDNTVYKLYRITNTERSPYRYMTDPKELYQAMK